MGIMFDDEAYKRQYNIAREKCILREYDDRCMFDKRRKHPVYYVPNMGIPARKKRSCMPDDYKSCPLFVFLKGMFVNG